MRRPEQTRPEMMLCEALKEIPGAVDFRTQEPFCFSDGQLHFADIYLPEHHTIIEVDSDHKLNRADAWEEIIASGRL